MVLNTKGKERRFQSLTLHRSYPAFAGNALSRLVYTKQELPFSKKGGDPAAPSGTATLLRLHPPYQAYLRQRPPLRVSLPASGILDSDGVTGGVYKARERIHLVILIRDY